MRRLMLGAVLSVAFGALALDNTVNNDFWNTTAYVNAQPVTLELTVTDDLGFFVPTAFVSAPQRDFDSHAPGLFILIH